MNNFEKAFAFLAPHEFNAVRHYSNRASDPGGATNYGVTQRELNNIRVRYIWLPADVKDLTEDQAKFIYKTDYWPTWAQIVDDRLAAKLFDMGVNIGTGTATMYIQELVGVTADGRLGPITLQYINNADPDTLLQGLVVHLTNHYQAWVAAAPDRAEYEEGLLARAKEIPS